MMLTIWSYLKKFPNYLKIIIIAYGVKKKLAHAKKMDGINMKLTKEHIRKIISEELEAMGMGSGKGNNREEEIT